MEGEETGNAAEFRLPLRRMLLVMARIGTSAVQSPAIRTSAQTSAPAALSWSYKALFWLFIVSVLATHAFFLWSVRGRVARGDPDFTVFYTAGKILREGRGAHLYHPATQQAVQREFATDSDIRRGPLPYIHPPFEALVFLPLTFLSYREAFVVWNVLNLGMLGVALGLLRRCMGALQRFPLWQWFMAALAFFPVFANFHQGQDAVLLLLIVVLAFRAFDRGAWFLAGCWLGFGVFKYHLILPLALMLAIWKGRKFVWGFVAVVAAVASMSLALVGWSGATAYPSFAWRIVSEPAFGGIPARQLPSLDGLLTGWPFAEAVPRLMQGMVLAASIVLLGVVARLKTPARGQRFFRLCIACAVITAPLVAYSTNSYDLSLLILPVALVADDCLLEPRKTLAATRRLFVPLIPVLISPLWFFLWMRWEHINLMTPFLLCWLYVIRQETVRPGREQGSLHSGAQIA